MPLKAIWIPGKPLKSSYCFPPRGTLQLATTKRAKPSVVRRLVACAALGVALAASSAPVENYLENNSEAPAPEVVSISYDGAGRICGTWEKIKRVALPFGLPAKVDILSTGTVCDGALLSLEMEISPKAIRKFADKNLSEALGTRPVSDRVPVEYSSEFPPEVLAKTEGIVGGILSFYRDDGRLLKFRYVIEKQAATD
jgi:hypothetical protein